MATSLVAQGRSLVAAPGGGSLVASDNGAPCCCQAAAPCPYYYKATLCNPGGCATPFDVYVCASFGCFDQQGVAHSWALPIADVAASPNVTTIGDSSPWHALASPAELFTDPTIDNSYVRVPAGASFEVALDNPVILQGHPDLYTLYIRARQLTPTGRTRIAYLQVLIKHNGLVTSEVDRPLGGTVFENIDGGGENIIAGFAGRTVVFTALTDPPQGQDGDHSLPGEGVDISFAGLLIPGWRPFQDGDVVHQELSTQCFRISTGEQFPSPPPGPILDGDVQCVPGGVAECLPLDGYYPGELCACSPRPQGVNLAVWIPCHCVHDAQAAGVGCPVFLAGLPDGTAVCVKPKLGLGVTLNIGEGSTVSGCGYFPDGCCGCCTACSGETITPYTYTRSPDGESDHFGIPTKCCCDESRAVKSVQGNIMGYFSSPACAGQLGYLVTWNGTIPGVIDWTVTQWPCGPGDPFGDTGACPRVTPCARGHDNCFIGLPGNVTQGSGSYTCYGGVESGQWGDPAGGGLYGTYVSSWSISPNAGQCDTGNCYSFHATNPNLPGFPSNPPTGLLTVPRIGRFL